MKKFEVNTNTAESKNLFASFIKFQGMVQNPGKTKEAKVGSFSYKYADLADITDVIRQPMHDVGLGYIQSIVNEENAVGVSTTLIHMSGESLTLSEPVMLDKSNAKTPQAIGSLLSYGRKYSLLLALGIVGDEDNDAKDLADPQPSKAEGKAVKVDKKINSSNRNLVAWGKLAEANAEEDRNEMRRFFAICSKLGIKADSSQKIIIKRALKRDIASRKDVTQQEYKMINELLESTSKEKITKLLETQTA